MRLIDADKIVYQYGGLANIGQHDYIEIAKYFKKQIDAQPTIDEVLVVRCKDCKHRISVERFEGEYGCNHENGLLGLVEDNYFCSYGERKDSENENNIQTNKN